LFSKEDTLCWKCGAPAPGAVAEEKKTNVRCGRCDVEAFTAARSVGLYEGALRAAVLSLKREPQIGAHLKNLLCEMQRRAPLNDATRILPVPLHKERQKERGFNQAAIIGRALAAHLPFDEWSLARTKHTQLHRAGMDVQARRLSVENSFEVQRQRLIEGERILLVDDVFTTGATVSSCAQALRAAGAEAVYVLTIARAEM